MLIISFAWTVPALIARRKKCTRRDWNESYAAKFHAGDLVQAYDKSPRIGGKRIGTVKLICTPYQEPAAAVANEPEDWENEGFAYLTEIGVTVHGKTPKDFWNGWLTSQYYVWVVRFEIVEIYTLIDNDFIKKHRDSRGRVYLPAGDVALAPDTKLDGISLIGDGMRSTRIEKVR